MRRRQKLNFKPMVLGDPHAYIVTRFLAAERSNDGTITCVRVDMTSSCVSTLLIDEIAVGVRFMVVDAEPVERRAQWLKSRALALGATPEAIRLLGLVMPVTMQEEAIMAEKLKAKGAAKADKEGLTKAAKAAPVGGKKAAAADAAPKKRGNADALAKAREAKANAGPDKRKITVLKKDHGARSGTARETLLNKIYKAKTVQAAVDAGVTKSDVSWAARAGYIQLDA